MKLKNNLVLIGTSIVVIAILYMANSALYSPWRIWNIALFRMPESAKIFEYDYSSPDKLFSPQKKVRTRFHYVTGYADPFLFVKDGWLYLFYEKELYHKNATICAQRTKDLKHWEKLGTVLQEEIHLSYPNVFEHQGDVYMIPETKDIESVVLYKSSSFPYEWERVSTLLEGDKYVDSSLLLHDGGWYLFTTSWRGKESGLYVYSSDSLKGPYFKHCFSPVTVDYSNMRCGGPVFEYEGNFYRPAQYNENYYGEDLLMYHIDSLSTNSYHESIVKNMLDHNNTWSTYGGHHFSSVVYNGERIVVMDGHVKDNWFNNRTRKIFDIFER